VFLVENLAGEQVQGRRLDKLRASVAEGTEAFAQHSMSSECRPGGWEPGQPPCHRVGGFFKVFGGDAERRSFGGAAAT